MAHSTSTDKTVLLGKKVFFDSGVLFGVKARRYYHASRQAAHPPVLKHDVMLLYYSSLGAAVPSDQVATGIMYSVIGSGAPANCGFNITGVPGKSAPHDLGSVSGT